MISLQRKTGWPWGVTVLVMCLLSGCACRNPHSGHAYIVAMRGGTSAVNRGLPEGDVEITLPRIAFVERSPIELAAVAEPIWGAPLSKVPPAIVRPMTFDQCRAMAARAAPTALQIEMHRNDLASRGLATATVCRALNHQAAYERNRHVAQSLESYLQLAGLYAQQPIWEQSAGQLEESRKALERFRQVGLASAAEISEVERRQLALEQRFEEYAFSEYQLQAGLALLLDLPVIDSAPLWTAYSSQVHPDIDPDAAVATALRCRGDLLAMECLLADRSADNQQAIDALVRGGAPLLGVTSPSQLPVRWWQCLLKEQLEQEARQAADASRKQLAHLARLKRREIEREVREVIRSLDRHIEILSLREAEMENLSRSLEAAEQAKEVEPIEFARHQLLRQRQLELTSEIVVSLFSIEVDRVRLSKAQGMYGAQPEDPSRTH